MPKNVIVVGAPRSGTSLTAAIFARQGYYVGGARRAAVVNGDDHNPFGYFEADDLIERNVQLFRHVGYMHHNTWLFEPISSAQIHALDHLEPEDEDLTLLEAYQHHAPWLWKDPRLCMTLGYWGPLIDWNKTGLILILREPEETYWSFRRKGWCPAGNAARAQVLARIEQHHAAALATVSRLKIPHVQLNYADYATDPESVARQLSESFDLTLAADDLNFQSELDHSSLRGRCSGYLRSFLKQLPRPLVERIELMLPRKLVATFFPERKYIARRN